MYKKTVLKNGMRLVTIPLKDSKSVTVLVLVGAGSKYEEKYNNGVSHFVEHMMFKGTKKRPNTKVITETLDKIGGQYNAFTGKEKTGYWVKTGKDYLNLSLDIVSDVLLNSKFSQNEIDRERKVIVEEINMYEDMPIRKVSDVFEELLYGDQPAGWDISGEKDVILKMNRKDIASYYQTHYKPSNIVVVVAGNFPENKIVKMVENYFGKMPDGAARGKLGVKEFQEKPGSLIIEKATDQTHFCLGVRAYDQFDERRYALTMLAAILGGYMSSRLFLSVRERQGLAYYIRTGVSLSSDHGYLMTQAGVNNEKVEKAIEAVIKEYRKVKNQGVTLEELKKVKEHIKGSMQLEFESSDDWADFYGGQELDYGKIRTPEEIMKSIEKVTLKEINAIAKDVFKSEKINLALIGPFKNSEKFNKLLKI